MFTSDSFNDSFSGSGFSYTDEYDDDGADFEDSAVFDDDSLNDFEDDDIYDESFEDELEEDDASGDDSFLDNGFNDDFDEI